jgi:hypothetical protein
LGLAYTLLIRKRFKSNPRQPVKLKASPTLFTNPFETMKPFAKYPVLASIALLFAACDVDRTQEPSIDLEADVARLAAFAYRHAPAVERFTIDAATGGTHTTPRGVRLTFPAGAIVTGNGQPVTGNVEVSVQHVTTPSEMVLSNRPTETAAGEILISFGELQVRMRQGGNELRLAANRVVDVQAPAPRNAGGAPQGFREVPLWNGDTTVQQTMQGLDWQAQQVSVTQSIRTARGVSWNNAPGMAMLNSGNQNLVFGLTQPLQLNWVNCDRLYSDPRPKTTVLTYFSQNFAPGTGQSYMGWQPSGLFFKPRGLNSVIKFYNQILTPPAGREGFYSYQNTIPIGIEGSFLAYSVINGRFYVEVRHNVTVPSPVNGFVGLTFSPQEVSESAFLAAIQSLDAQ